MTTRVWITFQQEGWHCWPSAPKNREYLRNTHRHMFHFKVEVEVTQADREVEMHWLKEKCLQILNMEYARASWSMFALEFKGESCEMIAEDLLEALQAFSATFKVKAVEVSEDGENGARVEI